MLNKVEELGRAERVEAGVVVPALHVRDWNFTSLSDAGVTGTRTDAWTAPATA
jgi:hypothetical protein